MTSIKELISNVSKKINVDILDNIIITDVIDKDIFINNFYKECLNTKFGSFNIIINYIKKCCKIIKIHSNYSNIVFYLYYKKNTNSIFKLIKIYKRLMILSEIYNINKELNFHLALCKFKRYMPQKNNIFDCIHFNGGFTNIRGNDIYIYRKCEYSKVILHEFLHHVNLINDSTITISNYDIHRIKTKFNISLNTVLLPNEAIIEFWATIYNLIFISCEYNINFDLLFKKELEFSYNQFIKILNHNNNNLWYEKTNIFCYFILKYILLCNYTDFLKFKLPYNSTDYINFLINKYDSIIVTKKYKKNKHLNAMIFSSF